MIINRRSIANVGITLLLLYAFFIGIFKRFLPNTAILFFLMLSLICVLIGNRFKVKKTSSFIFYDTVACILIVLFNRNARFAHGFFGLDFCIVLAFFVYLLLSYTNAWHNCYSKNMLYFGIFYGFTTIFLALFPSIYLNYVLPLFPENELSNLRLINKGIVVGFSSHFSTTAIYLVTTLSIPIIALLKKESFKKKERKLYLMLVVILFVSVLLTGKRAHSVFALFSAIVTYWILNREKKIKRGFYLFGGICAAVVVFYVIAQFLPQANNVIIRFIDKMDADNLLSGRVIMYLECLKMFKSNPIFGLGWGSFTYFTTFNNVNNAHNVFFQLLAENGLVLSIPFVIFIVYNYVHAVRIAMKAAIFVSKGRRKELCLVGSSLFLQTFFVLYCLTGNPLYDFQILMPYILSCAVSEYYYKDLKYKPIGGTRT